jgi:hypothetical protein
VHATVLAHSPAAAAAAAATARGAFTPWRLGPFTLLLPLVSTRRVYLRRGHAYGTVTQAFGVYREAFRRWVAMAQRSAVAHLRQRLRAYEAHHRAVHVFDDRSEEEYEGLAPKWHRLGVPPVDPAFCAADSLHYSLMHALFIGRSYGEEIKLPLPMIPGAGYRAHAARGAWDVSASVVPAWLATQLRASTAASAVKDCSGLVSALARVDRAVVHALYTAPPCIVRLLLLGFMPTRKTGQRHATNAGRLALNAFFVRKWGIAATRWAPLVRDGFVADGASHSSLTRQTASLESSARKKQLYSYSCDMLATNGMCPVASAGDMEDLGSFLSASAPSAGCGWHNRAGLTSGEGRRATAAALSVHGPRKACSCVMLDHTDRGASTREGQTTACLRQHARRHTEVVRYDGGGAGGGAGAGASTGMRTRTRKRQRVTVKLLSATPQDACSGTETDTDSDCN